LLKNVSETPRGEGKAKSLSGYTANEAVNRFRFFSLHHGFFAMIVSLKKMLLQILNIHVRRNRLLTKLLFGVKVDADSRIHWDFTTIILKRFLWTHVLSSHKVLEIGAGPYALLSIGLQRKRRCAVHACDINESYVTSALQCIRSNSASVDMVQSDLLQNIKGRYDIIFFNSVYIPTARGIFLGIDRLHKQTTDWCGGTDGMETIRNFIAGSRQHLTFQGKVLLGFNRIYLDMAVVKRCCASSGFTVAGIYSFPFYPSVIFVFEP
jgi:methylase of polypeptide subunit release factors